jgi:hypothetical protein
VVDHGVAPGYVVPVVVAQRRRSARARMFRALLAHIVREALFAKTSEEALSSPAQIRYF